MDPEQFEDVSNIIQSLHKLIKILIEIIFAISPLLALSTHEWANHYSFHSTYLLRVNGVFANFMAIFNDQQDVHRPGQ
jgi:hypothetical protein